ncbi:MAG: hypothetical protein DMF61_12370 [Blastocatellia bacterium AA13]|nr:MAG: hypothetical protein DMF61_12370 [Blastocatellia bacterium AA13]
MPISFFDPFMPARQIASEDIRTQARLPFAKLLVRIEHSRADPIRPFYQKMLSASTAHLSHLSRASDDKAYPMIYYLRLCSGGLP